MGPSVSLSTRVPRDLHERLSAEARARRVPVGTLARDLLAASVDTPPAGGTDPDAVQNEVRCLFTGMPPEAGLAREVCLALARTVEAGGTAGISAGKALLEETDRALRLYACEPDEDEDGGSPGA
jgi:hypothetical protein